MINTRKKAYIVDEEDIPKSVRKMKHASEKANLAEEKKKKRNKKIRKIILLFLVILILFLTVKIAISTHRWKMLANDMLVNEHSVIIDSDGNVIATLGDEKKKEKISYDSIPKNLKNAYVAIEDERFYSHGGVDIKRTVAASASYILHFGSSSFGGSTITQQLVKNLTTDSSDKISRKVKEWWKAWQLESCTSKEEILEAYLNNIYVGPNIYGVEAGAKYYFSKSASDLSLAECAFLAGINHSPNSYNPFVNDDISEKISKRAKLVLGKMKELSYISSQEYDEAVVSLDSGLNFKKGSIEAGSHIYSYHTDALISEITKEISDKYKVSEDFAKNYLELSGAKIYSTQASNIQKEIETEFEKTKYSLASKTGGSSSQAAMVVIDHESGYVLGCVGGLGKKTDVRPLNRATQSIRQTGSAMKPLAILAPAIDKKIITCASIYDDTERDFEKGYHPTDYNKSLGEVTVRRAVESSQNIPFVEIMEELKPKTSIKYLKQMGITSLTDNDEGLSLSLGGLDKGISPLEMAAGYSTIANNGKYIEPTFYTKVDRNNGKTLIKTKQDKKTVISEETAYIVKELLTQPVLGSHGTATYCKISGVDVAAKTGTTDENYDRWLCGFTPYYTAVTWFGYDINESIEFNNRNPAGLIWANVMNRIHSGLNGASFVKPNKVVCETICSETGRKATTGCSDTYVEYFLKGTVPDSCVIHTGNDIKTTTTSKPQSSGTIQGSSTEIDAEEPPRVTNSGSSNTSKSSSDETTNTSTSNTVSNSASSSSNTASNVNNSTNNTVNNSTVNSSKNTVNTIVNNVVSNSTTNTTNDVLQEDSE